MVGIIYNFLVTKLETIIVINLGGIGIGVQDVFNIAVLPYPVGNSYNVIDDVLVSFFKSS